MSKKRKCPYCKTIMKVQVTPDADYYTCECPGNVIVEVKIPFEQ